MVHGMAGISGPSQKTDDRIWSSLTRLKSFLTGKESSPERGPGHRGTEHGVIQMESDKGWEKVEHGVIQMESDKDWEKVQPKGDTLETLQKDRADSLLRSDELEQRLEIAERSARLKEGAIADLTQKQKIGRRKNSPKKHDTAQLIAKIDNFQKTEEKLMSELKQKEEQRYQATQQVLALREELSSSRHHIENLKQRMVDATQTMEGEMKQLLEITPEDIPEDVDVGVLVSQLRARLSMFERENQQAKVQSRQIQIMKQEQEGIEGDLESLKGTCENLERHNKTLADQLRRTKEENQQLRSQVEAKQAQAMTYKLDFDEERKDRAEAHSWYADLEKKMAELKKQHVQEISQITEDHKGSLGEVEGVKFALDKELRDWQAEALQSREELQAKTSQVKAYKKQVDQLKETSEREKQQISDLSEDVRSLLEELSTTRKSLPKKSDLPPSPASKGKSKTTEHKKKSTGELPSPCGGLEQKFAKTEKLCDTLQTENACLREAKRKSLLAEKALKAANDELNEKVEILLRNLKDLRVYIKKESEAGKLEKGCDKSPSAVENPILESDPPLRAKDPNMSAPLPITNTWVAASPPYPPSVHGQPSSMPSQSHTSPCDFIEHGPQSDGFGETNKSNAQFQQFHVHGNLDKVYRDESVPQGRSAVPLRGANDLVVPHHLPNTINYRDHNLAPQQQYNQGTHYSSNYSEPQTYPQQRQPDYQQQQWDSQDQQQYYDGQHPNVYSQQRQDQYRSQDPQQQTWHSQDQQQYHDQHFDQRPDVYNPQNQYDQSNAQSARRNLPIDLQGGHHSQRPISHDSYEHTPTPVTPENASNYSSYSSAQTSSDIGVDVPSPKPKPKPRMLKSARQAERLERGKEQALKNGYLKDPRSDIGDPTAKTKRSNQQQNVAQQPPNVNIPSATPMDRQDHDNSPQGYNQYQPRNVPQSNHPSQWHCQPGPPCEQPRCNQQHYYQQTQQKYGYQIRLQQPQWQSKSKNINNVEKSAQVCDALEGGLADCQSLIKRLQDGLAAFQTERDVLGKVTEERDCLLREIEYVSNDRDHLLQETAGQREIIATIQHDLKTKEKKCTNLAEETEKIRGDLQQAQNDCAKLLTSLKQCREESEQNIAEVRGRCEQETNRRIQQQRQAQRVFKQLDRRVKELVMLSPLMKGREVGSSRPYSQEVKTSVVNSKKSIQFSEQNRIGKGSFGSVYAVNLNGTPCIAKRLHDILMGRGKLEDVALEEKRAVHETFCRECILMRQANHANVVKFIGVHFGKDEFDLTLLMERLHTDLEVYLSSTPDVPLPTKVSILHDVSCGLLYLHEECSIIHRDLTAANILLTADNRAKIADLGVSRIFNRTFLQLSKIPGTLPYMPPEALKDGAIYDESLDVFSFGVLTLCVGIQMSPDLSWDHVPDDVHAKGEQEIFKRKMWIEMIEQKQPEISSLVLWCLSDDPKSRPSTYCVNVILQEMKHDL